MKIIEIMGLSVTVLFFWMINTECFILYQLAPKSLPSFSHSERIHGTGPVFVLDVVMSANKLAACIGRNRYACQNKAMHDFIFKNNPEVYRKLTTAKLIEEDGETIFNQLSTESQSLLKTGVGKLSESAAVVNATIIAKKAALQVGINLQLDVKKQKKLLEHVQKMHFTSFGVNVEPNTAINLGIKKTNRIQSRSLLSVHSQRHNCRVNVYLSGIYDGTKLNEQGEEVIVEIKSRMHRFLGMPDYDRIQLLAYLFIAKVNKGVLVETCRGDQQSHELLFDNNEWDAIKLQMEGLVLAYLDIVSFHGGLKRTDDHR
jgi:hypothetical protein